jgi:hypothetical protein
MKSAELQRAIQICAHVRRPLFTSGKPGGGKTFIHLKTFKAMGYNHRGVRLSTMDPVDMAGMPNIDERIGRMTWSIPNWWPRMDEKKVAIFFDEWSQGTPMVQNAGAEPIYDRTLGGGAHSLPECTVMFAAGNNMSDKAATNEMPSHIANRFIHVQFESDVDEWRRQHANRRGDAAIEMMAPLPAHDFNAPTAEEIVAFLSFRRDLLHVMPQADAEDDEGRTYPSPRSWEFVNNILPYVRGDEGLEFELISGCVGQGATTEFLGYCRLRAKMPDPNLIFSDPLRAPIPKNELAVLYGLTVALSRRVAKGKNDDALFAYLGREDFPQDFAVMCLKDTIAIDNELRANNKKAGKPEGRRITQCAEGVKLLSKNTHLVL